MPKINKYIDEELAAAESVSGTDKLLITQSGTPKAATISQVAGTVDLTGKADKVATSPAPTDYLAKFDVNGNLAVSTKQESDVGGDISAKADKVATSPDPTGYVATFDATGNLSKSDASIAELVGGDISGKADKVATSPDPTDHIAALDATGNLKDSTKTITQLAGVISAQHTHNTDTILDEGNENQVTALEIVTLRDTTVPGKADKVATSPAPTDYLAKFDADGNLAVSTKQEADIESSPTPEAESDFQVATGSPLAWVKKTLAEVKTILGLVLTQTAESVGFTIAGGTTSKTLTVDEDATLSAKANKLLTYIDCSASITSPTLTAAQVSGTVLTNFGQGAEDVQIKLPTAAAGYSFVAVMATAPSGNTWKVTADTNDKIYLDGVAGSDGESIIVTPSIGNFVTVFSFQTGESPDSYDWIAQTGQGTWTAGA